MVNSNIIRGDWKVLRGKLRAHWGKLTDNDLDFIAGRRDQLIGTLQKYYGIAQDEVEEQLQEFEAAEQVAQDRSPSSKREPASKQRAY